MHRAALLLATTAEASFLGRFFGKKPVSQEQACIPETRNDPDCVDIYPLFKDEDFDEDAEDLYAEATGKNVPSEVKEITETQCDGDDCQEFEKWMKKYVLNPTIGSGERRFRSSWMPGNHDDVGAMADLERMVGMQAAEKAAAWANCGNWSNNRWT